LRGSPQAAVTEILEDLPEDQRRLLRRRAHPAWVPPMLATLTEEYFSHPDWIYERKLDGVRLLAFRNGGSVRLLSRNRLGGNGAYPEVAEALEEQAPTDFVADGEVVAFEGRQTSFARLQGRMHFRDPRRSRASRIAIKLYLFDLLHLEGHDLTRLPLRTRKSLLRRALRFEDPLRFLTHRVEKGEAYRDEACGKGWEGVIAKRGSAPYAQGRSRDWLKFKCVADQELVIGGFTEPGGSRRGFGALLVGYFEDGEFVYAGKVGTGYNENTLADLRQRLDRLKRQDPPFARGVLPRKGVHWVEPRLVAQVGFTEWTGDGRLRHPRFLGLRRDQDPRGVTRERP
jgi:bifunctional non-homologous end joining protein LigD